MLKYIKKLLFKLNMKVFIIFSHLIAFTFSYFYLTEKLLNPIISVNNDYWISFEPNEINNTKLNIVKRFENENYSSTTSYIAYAFSEFELTLNDYNDEFKHHTWNFLVDKKEAVITYLYLEFNRNNSNITFIGKFISSTTSIPTLHKEDKHCYRLNRKFRLRTQKCKKSISIRQPTANELQLISLVLTNCITNYIRSISYQSTVNNKNHSEL